MPVNPQSADLCEGGRRVEEKIHLPPSKMPINTKVYNDLVEVEEKLQIKFGNVKRFLYLCRRK